MSGSFVLSYPKLYISLLYHSVTHLSVVYILGIMKIGLFIPCYVDALYPNVGVASYRLLKALGVDVDYPLGQTCCGQPESNGGFEEMAVSQAEHFEELFSSYDYVVGPSASCAAFVRVNYPKLLHGRHSCNTAQKVMDIVEFLHDVLKVKSLPGKFPHIVSVHNSCHGVRELGLSSPSERNIPTYSKIKNLLSLVEGITIKEPERPDECCGFGGLFSVEEKDVSLKMGMDKLRRHKETGAEFITGPDSSCLMHLQGIAKNEQTPIKFIHVVEILASGL